MADLPRIPPARQVWPVRPGEPSGRRKPPEPKERREKAPRDPDRRPSPGDDDPGHIDEYA